MITPASGNDVSSATLDEQFRGRLAGEVALTPPVREAGTSYAHEDARIATAIRSAQRPGTPIKILEAGCGNRWPIDLGDTPYTLFGIDLDAEALRIRKDVEKDLDESIVGDLCTVELPKEGFDVVYSAYVLEHIERADIALSNLISALKPGGLLILRLPDPQTARGFVTRRTPFWFHVLFAKYVERRPHAGEPGYAPYPTHYHPSIWRDELLSRHRSNGLRCFWIVSDDFAREERGFLGVMARRAADLLSILSFGQLGRGYTNLAYFFRKQA